MAKEANVVLGEDWDGPSSSVESELRASRRRRNIVALNRSPLARKIITFNLLALVILVAGVLYLNPFRDSLVLQREKGLIVESQLIANVFQAQFSDQTNVPNAFDISKTLQSLALPQGVEAYAFDTQGRLIASTEGRERPENAALANLEAKQRSTMITDFLNSAWETLSGIFGEGPEVGVQGSISDMASNLASKTTEGTQVHTGYDADGGAIFAVASPVIVNGVQIGAVAITSAEGEIDFLVRSEREQVLQMFVIAILVSVGLSLVLASTIANPLSDLAAAAELGRDKNARKMSPNRVRIPDLTARPDEIGRLSGALRGMVTALYDRIEGNEQFAADVAHEIKNPLASLRSAVGTLRVAKRDDQREKLLDVIDHDVRRLDRLVSDISNASRLDSELVREEEERFDLLHMLSNITDYLGSDAKSKGVEFISDLPNQPIYLQGLEARLAQVFVNLVTNAISFCDNGDAIRVWARQRENRVLIVVEDTGPGIPDQALQKIFQRFYSERPPGQFGNNSGLGLAISKQIVEAHGGVIWAENIRPTDADITSEPLGARFVVGLPL
ncbi:MULTISPECIES: sensor histidine kinase [Halocynthiibacter]|uniref:histidine kinase n=1 Tax=Halocynthiibacter halioticoli TaxID=2986804 RepID=A0AAE3J176_9RHOB|nr:MULTISPECIES: sensor histidine kinase [Halocynthiibacter]MCV6825903.1 sensor histidine kinase [Halocynthiibacter halioticoli]MCW4058904.1 sensor histidine kinase [Halocynthiibacter sp. SDUM655004]